MSHWSGLAYLPGLRCRSYLYRDPACSHGFHANMHELSWHDQGSAREHNAISEFGYVIVSNMWRLSYCMTAIEGGL